MDVVGVMAAYLPVVCVCVCVCVCVLHSLERQICCHNTVYAHVNGHDKTITVILAKHCIGQIHLKQQPGNYQCIN